MTTISGILTNGSSKPINGTIVFTAKKTTSRVLENTQVLVGVVSGNYSVDLLPCDYDVILMIDGHSKNRLGSIRVLADSRNGSLNDFLLNPSDSELASSSLQQFTELRDSAKKSADDAKKWAETIDVSTLVKKSGDTMKTLTISDGNNSGLRLTNEAGQIWQNRTYTDGSLGIERYDAVTDAWTMFLRFKDGKWRFENVDDVTINGKSVLKAGDGGLLSNAPAISDVFAADVSTGNYRYDINTANTPINGLGYISKISWNANESRVMAYVYNSLRAFTGFKDKNTGEVKYAELITTANSTVDSNGFYKKSSPILRLYGIENIEDVEEFTRAGVGLVNHEAIGVTAKRIDVGHYEIHGSKGFSKEGWYIQLPEDANGNKKFFAEYSVNKKNVITVKTFTKKFDFEKCEVVAGEPVDITDGRWIDVRLDMPVVESETAEVIEEIESATNELEPVESIKADKQSNNPL